MSYGLIPPTERQLAYIKAIEEVIDIPFTGESIEDASEYISMYQEEFQLQRSRNNFQY